MVVNPCKTCRGAGLLGKTRTIEITIPAGVENGTTRVVERGGNCVRGDRPPGDLELTIRVAPHEFFRRIGDDIVCSLPISFAQAALGGEIEIPTLDGQAKVKVPPETQSGQVFRLRGKGIKGVRSSYPGDLLCAVVVETPVRLTERQKELLRELEEATRKDAQRHSPRAKSFMDKVREFFAS